MHVALPKGTINQFKLALQSRQQALRGYCPNIYTVHRTTTTLEEKNFYFCVIDKSFIRALRRNFEYKKYVQYSKQRLYMIFFIYLRIMAIQANHFFWSNPNPLRNILSFSVDCKGFLRVFHRNFDSTLVFCFQNCSNLIIVQVIEKLSRKIWDQQNNLFEQ